MLTSAVSYAETPETVTSETPKTYTVYDDDGNEYVLNDGEVLGILRDKYGNVKEQCVISPHFSYIQGENKTLKPGETFTTYQYRIKGNFAVGFYCYYKDLSTPATTPGGYVAISIYDCDTVGGTRRSVKGGNFSTTDDDSTQVNFSDSSRRYKGLDTTLKLSSRPYYNAVFENVCTKTLTLCIYVDKD